MGTYSYKALDVEREEIRLIQLQPGNLDDEISFTIFHASLKPPEERPPSIRLSLGELQKTLSDGWLVKENLDGRYIFCQSGEKVVPSSWDHPTEDFDRTLYEQGMNDYLPGPGYKPEYEALSYTWASELKSEQACVLSGAISYLRPVAEMPIGGNLACALKHLRYEDKSRVLWIDALCINQEDVEERNLQVKRMGNIYSLAQRVVVWLGPEEGDSQHALATLKYVGDQVELTVDNSLCDSPGAEKSEWHSPFCSLPYDERTWTSLSFLFSRKWFNRVWVLQEVALTNRDAVVHCGSYVLP